MDTVTKAVLSSIAHRAENLYQTHQLFCTEAVVYTLSEGLNSGLAPEWAVRVASGFPEGVGRAGCMCGALSGGLIALGMFLGRDKPAGRGAGRMRRLSKQLHDAFKDAHKSTCCRVLIKKVKDDAKAHFAQCMGLTGSGAALAGEIILAQRPDVLKTVNHDFLNAEDGLAKSAFKRITGLVR